MAVNREKGGLFFYERVFYCIQINKSKELRKAYSTQDPVEVTKRDVSAGGEYANWLKTAIEINGYEDEIVDIPEKLCRLTD